MDRDSRNAVLLVAGGAYALLSLLPGVAAAILVVTAETGRGHLFGVAALCFLALPPLLVRAVLHRRRARVVTAGVAAMALAASLVVLYTASPDGHPLPGSMLHSEFLGPAGYRRFAAAALLPEIDQIKLGTYLIPAIDPYIDQAAARRIRAMTLRHYRAMEAEPEFAALGTVMPYAFEDRDAGHVFAYAPPHEATERLPAILFLHGSAGNFKAYFYLWKGFADRTRMVVVCPSFGFGNWDEPGGVAAIERARQWAVTTLGADESRIFLVGLSNGGTGVTRAAAENPDRYRGLVFISGVLEDDVLLGTPGSRKPGGLPWPILVIHGRDDDRVPLDEVARPVAHLVAVGAAVDEQLVNHEDHFLFFDRDEDVLGQVEVWLRGR